MKKTTIIILLFYLFIPFMGKWCVEMCSKMKLCSKEDANL